MEKTTPSAQEKLTWYLNAYRPIIYIHNFDFEAVDDLIANACRKSDDYKESDIVEYNNADGLVSFKKKKPLDQSMLENYMSSAGKLYQVLSNFLRVSPIKNVLVLKDIHEELRDPAVVARLKSIALRTMQAESGCQVALIIVSTKTVIPVELEQYITVLDMPAPNREEIKDILREYYEDNDGSPNKEPKLDEQLLSDLSLVFMGLSRFEICQILNLITRQHGRIKQEDKDLILREKEASIKKSGMLESIRVNEDISKIGGLKNLTTYLERKAYIYTNMAEAIEFGVDIPKGILIVGMPGCGKSLAAKVAAKLFNAPLLRLDVGRLLGKYVGESEENLRQAIRIAEAATPCVLWIDEIEKAFAGVGKDESGGGVTTRLFGFFLTWMQEKESAVYVVATANDISKIPPEFLRKGRFDEMFSVDLPNDKERKQIFEIHLSRRLKKKWKNCKIDLDDLVEKTKGKNGNEFSGADIESIVKTAIETAFEDRKGNDAKSVSRVLTQKDLLDAIAKTKPIKQIMPEKIKALQDSLDRYKFTSANSK